MISLLKNLGGSWEQARDGLYRDLESIETILNRWRVATFGATGVLPIEVGGTGSSSLANHGVLVGEGTNPVTTVLGTTNTVLHGHTGADPSFSTVVEADITLSNVTTNNVSITRHGFVPTLPNDATKYFDGTGNFTTVTAGLTNAQVSARVMLRA